MKKLQRKEKGITLIALIITVVIMLILAGVSISIITDDGGVFGKVGIVVNVYENSAQNEVDQIASIMNEIDDYFNGVSKQPTELKVGVKILEGMVPVIYNTQIQVGM